MMKNMYLANTTDPKLFKKNEKSKMVYPPLEFDTPKDVNP